MNYSKTPNSLQQHGLFLPHAMVFPFTVVIGGPADRVEFRVCVCGLIREKFEDMNDGDQIAESLVLCSSEPSGHFPHKALTRLILKAFFVPGFSDTHSSGILPAFLAIPSGLLISYLLKTSCASVSSIEKQILSSLWRSCLGPDSPVCLWVPEGILALEQIRELMLTMSSKEKVKLCSEYSVLEVGGVFSKLFFPCYIQPVYFSFNNTASAFLLCNIPLLHNFLVVQIPYNNKIILIPPSSFITAVICFTCM